MKKLGNNLYDVIGSLGGNIDQARIMSRAYQVRDRYASVIRGVYRKNAQLFLEHTNNVYITEKNGINLLIVYVDESIFAAELNAQRELIRLQMLQMFGEKVDEFEIHVSRGSYKSYHPYCEGEPESELVGNGFGLQEVSLTEQQELFIEEIIGNIQDNRLKMSIEKAMKADLKRNNIEDGKNIDI